jgi:hypothetical protein
MMKMPKRAEYWSEVLFRVSTPEEGISAKVFKETNEKQEELDKAYTKALRDLFTPYGMKVEREEIP